MSKRPLSPLSLGSTLATKGEGAVPETPPAAPTVVPPVTPPAPPIRPAVETVHATPPLPTAMNFKLRPEHSAALRLHQFKTGRGKQAVVEEALQQWLERNQHLI